MPYCIKCGAELESDSRFCSECGEMVGEILAMDSQPTAATLSSLHHGTQTDSIQDIFEVYLTGGPFFYKMKVVKVLKYKMIITPNEVKFCNALDGGNWFSRRYQEKKKIPRNQANKRIRFPDKTFTGKGESEHLNDWPLVHITDYSFFPMPFMPKTTFAISDEAYGKLRDWIPPITKEDLKKELHDWASGLILIGIVSIIFSDYLDPIWGIMLIAVGGLNFLITHRAMFIINSIIIIMAGIMNCIVGTITNNNFWGYFGIFQFLWGIQEMRKFSHYSSMRGE